MRASSRQKNLYHIPRSTLRRSAADAAGFGSQHIIQPKA
jgi:hypothetical protein